VKQEWLAKQKAEVEKLRSEALARSKVHRRAAQPRVLAARRARNLTRGNAAIILKDKYYEDTFQLCLFDKFANLMTIGKFVAEPELKHLWNETFCNYKVFITGIRKTSETEAEVESKVTFTSPQGTPKKVSKAIEGLQRRLAKVVSAKLVSQEVDLMGKPRRPGAGAFNRSLRWIVTFPSGDFEGIECLSIRVTKWYVPNVLRWDNAGFRSSDDCKNASKNQIFFYTPTALLLDKAQRSIKLTIKEKPADVKKKHVLQLWDDGWRVIR